MIKVWEDSNKDQLAEYVKDAPVLGKHVTTLTEHPSINAVLLAGEIMGVDGQVIATPPAEREQKVASLTASNRAVLLKLAHDQDNTPWANAIENSSDQAPQDIEHETARDIENRYTLSNALVLAVEDITSDSSKWVPDIRRVPETRLQYFLSARTAMGMPAIEGFSDSAALSLIYGDRVLGYNEIRQDYTPAKEFTSSCDLDTLTRIHEVLQRDVLIDEGGRIARAVIPPEIDPNKTFTLENVNFWLQNIAEGTWPIFLQGQHKEGMEPNSHDQTDYHLGTLALYPREMQIEISSAANHELALPVDDEGHRKPLVLEGEGSEDPRSAAIRGSTLYKNGIETIDQVTDVDSYLLALAKLVADETGDLSATMANIQTEGLLDRAHRAIVDISNFNIRHSQGRHISDTEAAARILAFDAGVLRVTRKLRGDPGGT